MDIVIPHVLESKPSGGMILRQVEHYYHQVLNCLGYPLAAPPLAGFLKRLYGLSGTWLVVSPIYWEASHNDAMLLATGEELNLSDEEGLAWFQVFSDFVGSDFAALHYHDPYTWLVKIKNQPLIDAKPAHLLRHQSMMPELTRLDQSLFWQTFLTEIQMLFNQYLSRHPRINHYPINGVWVWGNGDLNLPQNRYMVVDTPHTEKIAAVLSNQLKHFDAVNIYPNDALMLLENKNNIEEVQVKTKNQYVNWYWKNHAYQTRPQGWFRRLWSAIC